MARYQSPDGIQEPYKQTAWEQLITHLQSLEEAITGEEAAQICKSFLAGKRVFCSQEDQHRGFKQARKLLDQGMSRTDVMTALVERFGYSRQWSTCLVNAALDMRYRRATVKLTTLKLV